MERLRATLVEHGLESVEHLLTCASVGVQTVSDLGLLEESDLVSLSGLSLVARRKLLLLAAQFRVQPEAKRSLSVLNVSDVFARSLVAAAPDNLVTAADVRSLLAAPLPLPVLADVSHAELLAAATGRLLLESRPPDRAMPELEAIIESTYCNNVASGTEEVWASMADALVGRVLRKLSELSAFAYVDNRSSTDGSGATRSKLRPDYCGWSNQALLVKAEHKKTSPELPRALQELKSKMRCWNTLAMRGMPFLPCFAVGGEMLQFALLLSEPGGGIRLETVSDPLCMALPADRLRIMSASFNLFRVIVALRARMPHAILPLYETQLRVGGGSVTVLDDCVVKRCRRLAPPAVYNLLASGATIPCAIRVTSCRELSADAPLARLEMRPVGLQTSPGGEAELRAAVDSVLRALSALHAHGYVHRDVRWPNLLLTAGRQWILIDFELSDEIGAPLPVGAISLDLVAPEARPVDAQYFPADDVWQVGRLLQSWGGELSQEGAAFAAELTAAREARPSAGAALLHPWLAMAVGSRCESVPDIAPRPAEAARWEGPTMLPDR